MSDEGAPEEQSISFHIKTAGDNKYTVKVPLSMSVSGLKQLLSTEQYANIPTDRQRLIYSGRVLKDGDNLSVYKIKEGNTVHLVKAAQSNTQNAATGGASAANASSTSSGSTPALPTMAAGTGANNLLAGLTGARFAGLAQLPNQSMFGPDGGMGAPPEPEEAMRRLEDPEVRRQLSEALSNPAILDEMVRQNPVFANLPNGRQLLQTSLREFLNNPEIVRHSLRMQRAMGGGGLGGGGAGAGGFAAPGGVEDTAEGGSTNTASTGAGQQQGATPANPFASMFGMPPGGAAGADNPFAALLDPAMFGGAGAPGAGGQSDRNAPQGPFGNPFANPMTRQMAQNMAQNMMQNPQLMQQMMQSMFGSAPGGEQGQAGTDQNRAAGATEGGEGGQQQQQQQQQQQMPPNPFAALFGGGAAGGGANPLSMFGDMGAFGGGPPDNRPPEERYADQLRQLNDMGFFDFDRNIEALRRSGGSVQGAVNFLLGG